MKVFTSGEVTGTVKTWMKQNPDNSISLSPAPYIPNDNFQSQMSVGSKPNIGNEKAKEKALLFAYPN